MSVFDFKYNDGGRAAAGYRGRVHDCQIRAIAIYLDLPYAEVKRTSQRLRKDWCRRYPKAVRKDWSGPFMDHSSTVVPAHYGLVIGEVWDGTASCPKGTYTMSMEDAYGRFGDCILHGCILTDGKWSAHNTAVMDGVLNDTWDPRLAAWTNKDGTEYYAPMVVRSVYL